MFSFTIEPIFQNTLFCSLAIFQYKVSQIKLEIVFHKMEIMFYPESGEKYVIAHKDIIKKYQSLIQKFHHDNDKKRLYTIAMNIINDFYYGDLSLDMDREESSKMYFTLYQEHSSRNFFSLSQHETH
jgi:hypothetical protein